MLLVHVEHQAQPAQAFPQRMFRYFARLHGKCGLPVYPVALFSFAAPRRAQPTSYQVRFPHTTVLDFHYDVIQLNRLDWRDFMRNPNPLATALMARMHIAPAERTLVKLQCLRLLVTQHLDPARSHLIISFVEAYLTLNEDEQRGVRTGIQQLPRLEKERILKYTNQWIEEGRQEGRQEASLLLIKKWIVQRFGAITRPRSTRLTALSLPRLQALADVLLDLADANALDAWLAAESPPKPSRK
jgi:hypothetical protein